VRNWATEKNPPGFSCTVIHQLRIRKGSSAPKSRASRPLSICEPEALATFQSARIASFHRRIWSSIHH
jgi:hypothetical protein